VVTFRDIKSLKLPFFSFWNIVSENEDLELFVRDPCGGYVYAFLVNEKKYDENLNSVMSIHSFLTKKYIDAPVVMTQDEDNEGWMLIILIAITLFGAILILSVNFKL
jgi:hypothetical protein